MKRAPINPVFARRERGVALFVSLVLLLVLTIIGVSAVQTTSLETRMARNEHDLLLAFQAAESALRDAETDLLDIRTVEQTEIDFTDGGTGGLWAMADPGDPDRWVPEANWAPGGGNLVATTGLDDVAAPPRYMIEHLANIELDNNPTLMNPDYPVSTRRIAMFRITAIGVGGTPNARVMLQSTFGQLLD